MTSMDEKGLGVRLQEMRRQSGLTQQELCQRANLSYSTLAKIERGAIKSPSIFTIQSIAGALDTGLDELLGLASPGRPSDRDYRRTKSGVSFIFFDVNGCLVRFTHRAIARIAEDYNLPADLVETAYYHFNDDACRGALTLDDYNRAMAERLRIPSLDWAKYYLEAAEPLLEMHQALSWASEHYRFGLLTNTMPTLLSGLMQLGKVPNLPYNVVVDSSKVGAIKPETKIYEIAAEQAGVPVEQLLLIDDTQANLVVAERQGWHVILFDYARPEESAAVVREALEPTD